jgi:hypothetical protein
MPIIKDEFDLVFFIVLMMLIQYCVFNVMILAIDPNKTRNKTVRVFLKISIVIAAIPFIGLVYILPGMVLWFLTRVLFILVKPSLIGTMKNTREIWNKL